MRIELLMSPGCGHGQRTAALIAEVVAQAAPGAVIETVLVTTPEDALRLGFPGSPTVRVDGADIDPHPPASVGLG
jgi:hypothetical protein